MLKKFLSTKRLIWVFSGLLILALVPAIILAHPGRAAQASGGGGGSPTASIFPTQGGPGTAINVLGFNYPPSATVNIFFQTKSNGVITVTADQSGFFSSFLTAPETYTPGVRYFIHVNSLTFSEQVLFTFTKPNISVFSQGQFQQLTFGAPAGAQGSGFAANETVDLTWNFGSLGSMKGGIAATDSSGFFFSNFTMPSIPFGVQTQLTAHGRISNLSASTRVVEIPALYANPSQGVIGTTVNLSGGGFGSNETVKILFQGTVVGFRQTGLSGAFKDSFVVPSTAVIGFQNNGIIASGKTSGVAASAFFTVEPNVSISPNSGPGGTLITVRGSHFTPNGFVEILWVSPGGGSGSGGSGGGTQFLSEVNTTAHGTFSTTVTAPFGLIPGLKYFVLVIDGPTGASNQARFTATP